MKALHLLTIIGCLLGGITLIDATLSATGAPQQAAGAALAVALAVIPYCFVRAIELWVAPSQRELHKLNETLSEHTRLLERLANVSTAERKDGDSATSPAGTQI